jgi:hypothetical protein
VSDLHQGHQRLDRLPIPIVGGLIGLLGASVRMPKIHVGIVRYGTQHASPVVERIYARGKRFYKAYDTLQRFSNMNEFQGVSCTLSAWHVAGRRSSWWDMYKKVMASSMLSGFVFGGLLTYIAVMAYGSQKSAASVEKPPAVSSVKINGHYLVGGKLTATLSDGRVITTERFKQTADGVTFTIGSDIFEETKK